MSQEKTREKENENSAREKKLASTIGLCKRAGYLVFGTPMVCDAMRKRAGIVMVLEASDTSDNTHEKLVSKCAFYGVPLHRIPLSTQGLGRCIGKLGAVAAVGITNKDLAIAIQRNLSPQGDDLK